MGKDARGMKRGGSLEVKGEAQERRFELGSKIKKQSSEKLPLCVVESCSLNIYGRRGRLTVTCPERGSLQG